MWGPATKEIKMSQFIMQIRDDQELQVLMEFFGTRSKAAAIRSALQLAVHVTRSAGSAKDKVIVKDLNRGGYAQIKFSR